jgi:hypothetical protein
MKTNLYTAMVILSLSAACSGTGGTDEYADGANGGSDSAKTEADAIGTATQGSKIVTLDVEGAQHTFIDNGTSIGISVEANDARGVPMVFRLLEEFGELTSLELYLAMAPQGASVDSRLIEAHKTESAVLGRADETVRNVTLSAPTTIEKGTVANCKSWATTKRGGSTPTVISSSPTGNSTLSMAFGTANKNRVAAAICNIARSSSDSGLAATVESNPASVWGQVGSSGDDNSPFILPENTATPNDLNSYAYVEGPSAVNRRFRINGFFLGAGHTYFMAIAY